ncbi:DUF2946 domain-containing protein [Bradyrhizobium sp. U87765 SZCCT0131]|uniref:DUF2946 domain-containing protein n=1 Tax=Bradyrhizobium sp. U87765 SZCCT0109 TaxID=2807656 RepID=UPI001BAC9E1F|nr:DUF2946 domain-containing protein [Bradyrhizobium sp. U87765 SZCCT0131]MBR1261989.1 DUF2946 domain-containing protein [Bradyrhizobium sp. U87765 SZCCT0134]MBR1306158.1 DUF2946 domain-containing protein [Bradyrhizobium sp. U87765 SZCCT0110]MBR1317771.1 DUF2946 domain-containing protein [Bradyrhizobium sp. U87765 SZCCT0109]MBR1351473.1 DUF2946 domain-containing protein [Bradyrhizobium sp. U87765 SZCCT0048]
MALMMQIIAPIGASWATAARLSDPLAAFGNAAICHTEGGETNGQSAPVGPHAHDGACALCCLAHAVASPDAPKTEIGVPYRSSSPVVWRNVAPEPRDSREGRHAQARAPPSNT